MKMRKTFRFNSNRSVAILSGGREETEADISGSLGVGRSLTQVTHWATRSSICFKSPGHQTDLRALDRHLRLPK